MPDDCLTCPTHAELIRLNRDEREIVEASFGYEFPADAAVCPDCLEGIRKSLQKQAQRTDAA